MKSSNINASFKTSTFDKTLMKWSSLRVALFLALLTGGGLGVGGSARAAAIFDNLGSNVGGFDSVNSNNWFGQKFNSDSTNLDLTTVTLRLYSSNAGGGTFFLRLYDDSGGHPGVSLSTLFTGSEPFPGPYPQDGNIAFGGLNRSLAPNTNYWLVLGENPGAAFDLRWGVASIPTNPPGTGSGYQEHLATTSDQGTNWIVDRGGGAPGAALAQINAVVPEPNAAMSFVLGVVALMTVRLRRISKAGFQTPSA